MILGPELLKVIQENQNTEFMSLFSPQHPNACVNASPTNLCRDVRNAEVHPEYAFSYVLCMPSMLSLTLWQLSTVPFIRKSPSAFFYRAPGKRILPLFVLLHLFAILLFVPPFIFFFKGIDDLFRYDLVSSDWNFGQIVALTLWLPSLIGFVNTVWDGVGPAHAKQMPVRYDIVKCKSE